MNLAFYVREDELSKQVEQQDRKSVCRERV